MELTKENVLNALKHCLKDYKSINVHHGQWNKGCGRDAVLDHYYTKIGDTELESKTIGYSKSDKLIREALKEFKGLTIVEKMQWYPTKYKDCWGCDITEEHNFVTEIIRIDPCKSFTAINKWLEKHGVAPIGLSDMYLADLCKKRSSVSVSDKYFYAENEKYCSKLLDYLRKNKSSKDTITIEINNDDSYDGDCGSNYEYETYGRRVAYPHIIIKTPTGRVKAETDAYTI